HVFDFRMRPCGRAEVAAFPCRVDRAHEVEVLRHRLSPFLGEAFGGSTGLVGVGVVHDVLEEPVRPGCHGSPAELQPPVTAAWAGALDADEERYALAEVAELLKHL